VRPEAPFGRWGARLYEGLGHLGGLILAVMTLAVFAQVVLRYVFAYAVEGMDEVPRYLFVWLVMIGAAAATHRGQHTTLEFFRDRLGARGRALARVVTGLAGMVLFLSLIRSSFVLVPNSQQQSSAGLNLPLGYVYAAVPVGAVLILLPMAWHVVRALRELWQRPS
jgi:TRAP-type transport system small permease protein